MSAGVEPREVALPGTPTPSAETREPVLEIKDLSIAYRTGGADVRAVRGVDLDRVDAEGAVAGDDDHLPIGVGKGGRDAVGHAHPKAPKRP